MIQAMASKSPDKGVTDPDPQPHRWTRGEYYAIADTGIFEGRRVELIDGNIVDMSPQKSRHATAIMLAQQALVRIFGVDAAIRTQLPLSISENSEPEPDLAVVPGSPRGYADHPATALLVIEVSDTTLAFDRGHKASLYASAGVEDYWVVDLNNHQLDIFRSPTPDAAAPFGQRYTERRSLGPNDSIAPLAKPNQPVKVADLLP